MVALQQVNHCSRGNLMSHGTEVRVAGQGKIRPLHLMLVAVRLHVRRYEIHSESLALGDL